MKVFDLLCATGHTFEGWFASEDDFVQQRANGLLTCPVCGSSQIDKKLSAPRIRKSAEHHSHTPSPEAPDDAAMVQAVYERMVQHVLTHTTDVGDQFVDQARKMHAGEMEEAPIRGKASAEEAQALLEEGIGVVALPIPKASEGSLQ